MRAIALAGLLVPAAGHAATVVDSDRGVRAAATARLAEADGDARSALAALIDVASAAPGTTGLDSRILEQAIVVGDLRRASEAANRMWLAGEQRFDARIILLVDALRRGDWSSARSYAADGDRKSGADLTARLIAPVLNGWIDVALRNRQPDRYLANFGRMGEDPTTGWLGATMVLLSGEAVVARERALSLPLSNRTSQMAAARLAASFAKRGDAATATALLDRVGDAAKGRQVKTMAAPLPVEDARQGAAQWFAMLGDGFARTPGGNKPLGLLFARAAQWLHPADPMGQLALAEALAQSGQKGAALLLLEKGAESRPIGNEFALRRAELLASEQQVAEAVAAALPGGVDPPDDIVWLTRFADIARQADNDSVAIATFDKILAASQGDLGSARLRSGVLIAKADILSRKGQWPEARALLEAALAASPDDAATLNYVGYAQLERRDTIPQALARIERAWRQDESNAAVTDSLGWAYLLTGDVRRALPLLEKAAQAEPDNAVIAEHHGDALWKNGQRFEARYAWRAALILAETSMAERLTAKLADGLTDANLAP